MTDYEGPAPERSDIGAAYARADARYQLRIEKAARERARPQVAQSPMQFLTMGQGYRVFHPDGVVTVVARGYSRIHDPWYEWTHEYHFRPMASP